ncbi:MAG TPA: S9 family peptidase [Acidobacteriota bacterium]|nr:S9 family peptidase [Acidobacteriota bacterium]HQF88781.1 S9 family peptidase [Acidobacteriota bacterium]HQG91186.1 S9 family peptidase [Acidobacteriota bacterium]
MGATPATETHPFSVHDMLAMDRVSEPAVSPDGKLVVFTLRRTDLDANRGRTDLWVVGTDGTGLRRLTTHEAGDNNPVWSPCGGCIFFLSTRSGSSQVWRIRLDGGEATPVTKLPLDVANLGISPDGKLLLFSMDVYPDLKTVAETASRLSELEKSKATGRIWDRLFVRHWDTWTDGRRSHLFVMPMAGGEPVDLMAGMDADAPSKPFGGTEEFTFTPDSRGVVFTARDAGRAEAWSTNFDLYLAPVDASAPPKKLTDNPAWDTQPAFSPDGKTLAYLAMKRAGYEADRYAIMLRAWPDGAAKELAPGWDRSPQNIAWSPDGKTIYAAADNLGQTSLFAIDVATGAARVVVEQGTVSDPSPAGDVILYGLDHLKSPVELYTVRPDGSSVRKITAINDAKVAAARMGDFEQFTFKGWNNETVYGYVVKPADFDPARKYPVAYLIHGGPQGSFGNHFHYRWNPQAYTGAGYAAVMVDFHGSTGYGQAFCDAIRGDWGGKPLEDLQKGLAAAVARYPWLDGERVAALGASYGGYMINWIAGNWPDRFRALVVHDGNLDERMAYYDTEELWFPEWDHEGLPWEKPEHYTRHNPIDYVKNWRTPTLVIHGGKDYRVVDTQGLSTFTALQRRGVESRFLHFPDENHWVLKPHNSILWHDTVIAWLDKFCKADVK